MSAAPADVRRRAAAIDLLVLDVDGILTDGKLYIGANQQEMKAFHTLDGHGIKLLARAGIEVAIITGRTSAAVERRAGDLGVRLLAQGREDKWAALQELTRERPVPPERIACMGDDWPDLLIMTRVGLALTVPSAHREVLDRAHWVSQAPAGGGAVREAADLLLQASGRYAAALAPYTGARA